ncbi:hypothetical protein CPC08DRAFT_702353 [Agrocybe pediades]|nr:hypothetical protein CPC08DRAFT_702353 [Agrocybe pediades]
MIRLRNSFEAFTLCHKCRKSSYSTSSGPYNAEKIRALPFIMSPDYARREMAKWAAYMMQESPSVILKHEIASMFKRSNLKYQRPPRFSAVYYPCWVVNADLEAPVGFNGKHKVESALFRNTYFPGSHVPPLSGLGLPFSADLVPDLVPFTTDLLWQQDMRVIPIPFSMSPMAFIDYVREKRRGIKYETVEILLALHQTHMFAAYPVLLPMYIAEYSLGKKAKPIRLMMPAFEEKPTIILSPGDASEVYPEDFTELPVGPGGRQLFRLFLSRWRLMLSKYAGLSVHSGYLTDIGLYTGDIPRLASMIFEQYVCSHRYKDLASLSRAEYDDGDPRVRPLTKDEMDMVEAYMSEAEAVLDAKSRIEALEGEGEYPVSYRTIGKFAKLHKELIDAKVAQKDVIPPWWIEYIDAHRGSKS